MLAISVGMTVALLAGRAVHAETLRIGGATSAPDPVAAAVTEAAQRFSIPAAWISAVMQVESGGDARAVSPQGAMGLMQIMPETWVTLRVRYGLGADPFDPRDNVIAGAAYLRELHDRYGEPGFLAAYNAGPGRYEDHLATGRPLPVETQNYVAVLAQMIDNGAIDEASMVAVAARPWTEAPLFTARSASRSATAQAMPDAQADHRLADTATQDLAALRPQSDGLFVSISQRISRP